MKNRVRKANIDDLEFIKSLEKLSFPEFQQSSLVALKRSLSSQNQSVFIAETEEGKAAGALILFVFKRSIRIYSIAVHQDFRNLGFGELLLSYAVDFAKQFQKERLFLEVDAQNQLLIDWYAKRGFYLLEKLTDYYQIGRDAYRMEMSLQLFLERKSLQNIIVINQPHQWVFESVNAQIVPVKEYINNPAYHNNTDLRVFNLCTSYKYQSFGYYVSLLATARNQRVIPNAVTISDFKLINVIRSVTAELKELIDDALKKVNVSNYELNVYFGQSVQKGFSRLAMKLYQIIEAPLFKVSFHKDANNTFIKEVKVLSLSRLPESELPYIGEFAKRYFAKKRFNKAKLVNYKYDLAILINPKKETPPSCPKALQKIKDAANKRGIYTEFIHPKDFDKINEFDALFIRETTNVNNHTYEFSRMAYAEGLVVIDDPWSILKCSNKIYQNEVFKKNKIKTPDTIVFTKNHFKKEMLDQLEFPLVLKQPDSAFSLGVTKVESKEEAEKALQNLFKSSDMVIGQAFLYSDYDWRIGVLDNQALYACKYYMSKGHWQIYNWKTADNKELEGDYEALALSEVPAKVIETALKAAAQFGDGLYGVDLKEVKGEVYVIEVNDNPNIDFGVEDQFLKDKLYDRLIDSIYRRIEQSKNILER
ncbi:MAG: GNAT family N-acetyltransferase [Flavobacteriales bacterium]|nr:GNAT family N-acetyltransferase [Flavobacteriales bacterium]|tara:strand:- start:12387 stop:14330 length:1944 start_codon:yes stop_codon:yes gene_type:complete